MTGMAASPKNTAASSTSMPHVLQLQRRQRHHRQYRPHHRRQQRKRHQGRECDTTLTGRQWGIAPRIGAAWQPAMFHSKVVVRAGAGMYYDRGELFSYLLARLRHRHRHRRTIRRQPATPLRERLKLPHILAIALRRFRIVLHSNLRRKRRLRSAHRPADRRRPATSKIPTAPPFNIQRRQSQGIGPGKLPAQRLQHRELRRRRARRDQQRPAHFARRLQPRQQAALHLQLHARRPMAAAERSRH